MTALDAWGDRAPAYKALIATLATTAALSGGAQAFSPAPATAMIDSNISQSKCEFFFGTWDWFNETCDINIGGGGGTSGPLHAGPGAGGSRGGSGSGEKSGGSGGSGSGSQLPPASPGDHENSGLPQKIGKPTSWRQEVYCVRLQHEADDLRLEDDYEDGFWRRFKRFFVGTERERWDRIRAEWRGWECTEALGHGLAPK